MLLQPNKDLEGTSGLEVDGMYPQTSPQWIVMGIPRFLARCRAGRYVSLHKILQMLRNIST
jgi:hypothetical protein